MSETCLMDCLVNLVNCTMLTSQSKTLVTWLCYNISKFKYILTDDIIIVVLRVVNKIFQDQILLNFNERRLQNCLYVIVNILESDLEKQHQKVLTEVKTLNEILQFALTSEQYELISLADKIIGSLMSTNAENLQNVIKVLPDIHIFIIQAIEQIDFNNKLDNKVTKDKKQTIIKEALWAISNIAANGHQIIQDMIDDKTFEKIVELAMTIGCSAPSILSETIFVITNIITLCSYDQFQNLLDPQIVALLVKVIQSSHESRRLYINALESIDRYLKYDSEHRLQEEASVLNYFEGLGGYEALLGMTKSQFMDCSNGAWDILDTYFKEPFASEAIYSYEYPHRHPNDQNNQ